MLGWAPLLGARKEEREEKKEKKRVKGRTAPAAGLLLRYRRPAWQPPLPALIAEGRNEKWPRVSLGRWPPWILFPRDARRSIRSKSTTNIDRAGYCKLGRESA
jgi:hypothetical protein